MFETLVMEGYRGFRTFRMEGLSRVNLLVGQNNCGKTSVLEAVQFLASKGDPRLLARIASQRGETLIRASDSEERRPDVVPDISHFFLGHQLSPGSEFSLDGGDEVGAITVLVRSLGEIDSQEFLFPELRSSFLDRLSGKEMLVLDVRGGERDSDNKREPFLVSPEGAVLRLNHRGFHRAMIPPGFGAPPIFISPESLEPRSMTEMWDRVVELGDESDVVQAMKLLDADIDSIMFRVGDSSNRYGGRSGVLVGLENSKPRVPLGSFGDGVRRVLALALALANSSGSVLLIDEIDTGFHWSMMPKLWRLVTEMATADRLDIQVFATTHSLDCIRGLAKFCEQEASLAEQVTVHKVDCELERSVRFDANEVHLAVEQEIEVR